MRYYYIKTILFLVVVFSILTCEAQWTPWITQNNEQLGSLYSACFTDSNTVYAVGGEGDIIKSLDHGQTWIKQHSNSSSFLKDISFPTLNTGYVVGQDGTILKTINGGELWVPLNSGSSKHLRSVSFADSMVGLVAEGWVSPTGSEILKTKDGGVTWDKYNINYSSLYDVVLLDRDTGFIVGRNISNTATVILKTSDGGFSWTQVFINYGQDGLYSLAFVDHITGYVCGKNGKIFKTINGGNSWIPVNSGTTKALNCIRFINENQGYAVGENATVIYTTDGGSSWQPIIVGEKYLIYDPTFFSIALAPNGNGVIVGPGRLIYYSDVSGISGWDIIGTTSPTIIYSIFAKKNEEIFACGGNSSILKSIDGGVNWELVYGGVPISASLNSILFIGTDTGIAVGRWGTILNSIDGGQTWDSVYSGTSKTLNKVICIGGLCYVFGNSGVILRSSNNGISWDSVSSNLTITQDIIDVYFEDSITGYSVLSDKTVRRTTDGALTWDSTYTIAEAPTSITKISSNLFVTTNDYIYRTFDNGQNFWPTVEKTGHGCTYRQVWAIDNILYASTGHEIFRSFDEGLSWEMKWVFGSVPCAAKIFVVDSTEIIEIAGYDVIKNKPTLPVWLESTHYTYPFWDYLSDIFFYDATRGWTIGSRGQIFKTTTGGSSWEKVNSGTQFNLTSVYFTDSLNGCIAGEHGIIQKTMDGGFSWQTYYLNINIDLKDIFFSSKDTGYIISKDNVYKTLDAGNSWINVFDTNNVTFNKCYFINNDTGFICGNSSLYKTTNGGNTWLYQSVPLSGDLVSIKFLNNKVGFVSNAVNKIIKTTNGGASWTVINTGSTIGYDQNHLDFADSSFGFLVSSNGVSKGEIRKALNGGDNWIQSYHTFYDGGFLGVATPENDLAYAVGYHNTILKYVFGCAIYNWKNVGTFTTKNLYSIFFYSDSLGFVVGGNGKIFKTDNKGATWSEKNSGTNYWLNAVHFPSDNIGYAAAAGGSISKTTDGGETWTDTLIRNDIIYDIYFIDTLVGYFVYGNGGIAQTTDGGKNWIDLNSGHTYILYSVKFLSDSIGFVCGQGIIQKTIDAGLTWDFYFVNKDLKDIFFITAQIGFAVGQDGTILKTVDGGISWQSKKSLTLKWLEDIYFYDNNYGLAVGEDGIILKTKDGGENWQIESSNSYGDNFYGVHIFDDSTAYICGQDGDLFTECDGKNESNCSQPFFNISDSILCKENTVAFYNQTTGSNSYFWVNDDNNIFSSDFHTVKTFSDTGFHSVTLYSVGNNCTKALTKTIYVSDYPTSNILNVEDTTICEDDTIMLYADPIGDYYIWSNGDTSQYILVYSNGSYYVRTYRNGCYSESDISNVTVQMTQYSIIKDTAICVGDTVTLYCTQGFEYLWTPSLYLSDSITFNPKSSPEGDIKYYLSIINNLCTINDSVFVAVNPIPMISLSKDTVICIGNSVQLNSSGGNSYIWTPDTWLNNISIKDPISSPLNSILYYLIVTDSNGCNNIDSIFIEVDSCSSPNTGIFLLDKSTPLFYPNPYSNNTNITYSINETSTVLLEVYNTLGEKLTVLQNSISNPGTYTQQFSGKQLGYSSGIYIVKLTIGDNTYSQRLIELE